MPGPLFHLVNLFSSFETKFPQDDQKFLWQLLQISL